MSTGPKVSGAFKKREPVCTQNRFKGVKLWDYKQRREGLSAHNLQQQLIYFKILFTKIKPKNCSSLIESRHY